MAAATPLAAEVTGRRTARITWSFPVEPWMCNAAGNIHGGAVASIFDNLTSFSIAAVSEPGFWETGGVSRTLSCTYLRPAPRGATMTLVVEVVHAGRTLMTLAGRMLDPEGRVTATCEHLKVTPLRCEVGRGRLTMCVAGFCRGEVEYEAVVDA